MMPKADEPPVAVELKAWPFNGYAPGNYTSRCHKCVELFDGDRRAVTCLECAVLITKEINRHAPQPVGREASEGEVVALLRSEARATFGGNHTFADDDVRAFSAEIIRLRERLSSTDRFAEGVEAAAKVAISHSNYGHVEGNKRAFTIASDLEHRAAAIRNLTKDEGEG